MRYPDHNRKKVAVVLIMAAIVIAAGLWEFGRTRGRVTSANVPPAAKSSATASEPALDLSPSQVNSIKIEPVGTHRFPVEKDAVGNIDFDEDLSVQVFPPYQGKIISTFVELGDEVHKGQPLYTIDSPDLIQAESTLIGAAADLRTDHQRTGARQGS